MGNTLPNQMVPSPLVPSPQVTNIMTQRTGIEKKLKTYHFELEFHVTLLMTFFFHIY